MKVAHLSGLHLGREDSVRAFRAAFDRIAEMEPQLVVVAGNVFEHPGVSASAVALFGETVAGLHERLPDVVVAVAAGARDTPLDPERRGPLALAGALDPVEVACASVRRVRVADGALSATLVPHGALALLDRPAASDPNPLALAPDPRATWNVLVIHAALADADSSAPALDATGWDYVAMGSAQVRRRVSDRVHDAGTLAADDGGFLLARLETGQVTHCPVKVRTAVHSTPGDAASSSAATSARPASSSAPSADAPSADATPAIPTIPMLERLGRALGASGSELADARGMAAFVGDGDALLEGARSALAHALGDGSRALGAGRPADHGLRGDELAALWCGAGSVGQWHATGAKLLQPQRPVADPEEQLRALREQAAEAKGDLEAGTVAWVRERQDAETRLLLYRDRGRELKARLAEIDDAGPDAPCGACGRPLGDRFDKVRAARREEWEDMVRDGRWWRRRRDQLELKPTDLQRAEARSLELAATVAELSPVTSAPSAGAGKSNEARAHPDAPARDRYRALVHARTRSLTGGRLDGGLSVLYAEWEKGRRRDGSDVAALELAARIVMAELATDSGPGLDSMVIPVGLDRLAPDDRSRALVELGRLARRVPLVLVAAPEDVACAAPERFDFVFWTEDAPDGPRLHRRRLGPRAVRLRHG